MQGNENNKFAENLRILLKKTGVTQRFFSENLGITEDAVGCWKRGESIPPGPRMEKVAKFFNERIPGLHLTAEKLLREDLSIEIRLAGKKSQEVEPSYAPAEPGAMTQGLFDLMMDRKTMELMKITKEEIEILKAARFAPGRFRPTREFYIDMLFHLRKVKEE